jgi:histidyl-tRNA synthetase
MTSTQHKAKQFQAIKGVRDILPPESAPWNRVEQAAREVFGTFGFAEIRLPIFEPVELFARSIGLDTDVVSKEMYTFEDHDQPDLARLRSTLVLWEPWQPSHQDVHWYLTQLGSFYAAFKRVYETGDIPRTPDNDQAQHLLFNSLRDVQDQLSMFSTILKVEEQSQTGPAVEGSVISVDQFGPVQEKFEDSVRTVTHVLQTIKLGDEVTLRPEATASVVRAYIEHGMQTLPGNVKLYYMGPMFRRERPQKGRYRQFYQIGAEVLGTSDAPGIDAEVIEMLLAFFERLKLKGAVLHINSIGDKICRPAYVEKLRAELQVVREKLGADSQRRIETNPLRVLDSKLESEQAIIEKLPRIAEHLCEPCREHYAEVKRQLALRGIAYQENWRLVRGLDYYMRTTFEITATGLGSQNAVCGGGRYDGLVELLGGPAATKGIGFAIGTDRLVLSLQESGGGEVAGGPAGSAGGLDVYLAWFGAPAQAAAVKLARRLRDEGFVVELPAVEMKFGKSLGLADRLKARHAVILGEDELAAGVVTVKRLADGTQKKLAEAELFSYLRDARAAS